MPGPLGFIGSLLAGLLLRPRGLRRAGHRSRIGFPRRLRGRHCIEIGDDTRIDSHAWLEAVTRYGVQRFEPRLVIGRDVRIGRYTTITLTSRVEIGDGCMLSEGVYISDTSHDVEGPGPLPLAQRPLVFDGEVRIGARCFLGVRACVRPGVTLGEGCIVGAHSVVTRSFDAGSVIAGVPARLLRRVDATAQ